MNTSDSRLDACRKAGKALSLAQKSGDPSFHSETVHQQVSTRVASILAQHSDRTFTNAQREAICELLSSVLLMNIIASQPKESWLSALWSDFKAQRPWQQIASIVAFLGFLGVAGGVVGVGWSYTPTVLRMVLANVEPAGQTAAQEEIQGIEGKAEPGKETVVKP